MEDRALGLGYLESSTLWGKSLQYLLRGDCVDLSTRINLDGHQLSAIAAEKLKSGIKGYLAIRHTLCVQGTFRLGCVFNTVCKYDIDAILGVPVGGLLAT